MKSGLSSCPALCRMHGRLSVNKTDCYHPLPPCPWHCVKSRGVMGRPSWKFDVRAIGERELGFTQYSPNNPRTSLISSKDTLQQPPRGGCRRFRVRLATFICHCQMNCSLLEVLWSQRQRRLATTNPLALLPSLCKPPCVSLPGSCKYFLQQ